MLADIAKVGYDAEWYIVSASAVGAMHRRERIFILAYPNSERCLDSRSEVITTETKQSSFRNDCLFVQWASRSNICRAPDGLPYGTQRIAKLGNAVVPQVAQVFAQAIKEYEVKTE